MATISSDVAAGYANNAVLAEVQATLTDFGQTMPPGYPPSVHGPVSGAGRGDGVPRRCISDGVDVDRLHPHQPVQFVVKPVIILTSVIMSIAGVFIGLLIFRMPFGIINTGVGIISLAGIVVNNAIILIDYIDILRERDAMDRREALVQGGKTRFRPVVLTATTTALGLVPLAIGLNFDFFGLYGSLNPAALLGRRTGGVWGPMAVAIIRGHSVRHILDLGLGAGDVLARRRRHVVPKEALHTL